MDGSDAASVSSVTPYCKWRNQRKRCLDHRPLRRRGGRDALRPLQHGLRAAGDPAVAHRVLSQRSAGGAGGGVRRGLCRPARDVGDDAPAAPRPRVPARAPPRAGADLAAGGAARVFRGPLRARGKGGRGGHGFRGAAAARGGAGGAGGARAARLGSPRPVPRAGGRHRPRRGRHTRGDRGRAAAGAAPPPGGAGRAGAPPRNTPRPSSSERSSRRTTGAYGRAQRARETRRSTPPRPDRSGATRWPRS